MLQFKRPLIVRYFDEFVRAVPEGLYFSSLDRKGDKFSIKGVTESNNRVSTLMRNLDRSDWFEAPNLKNVIADKFDLSVDAVSPSNEGRHKNKVDCLIFFRQIIRCHKRKRTQLVPVDYMRPKINRLVNQNTVRT